MLVDDDRRFLLQLSLALHIPVQELEQYPSSLIQEYRALNIVSPFTNDSQLVRDGLLIELIRNQNVSKKKDYRSAEQILPYLAKYPDYLEHPVVKKASNLISLCKSSEQKKDLLSKIKEEIELEQGKQDSDDYLISRLSHIYHQQMRATNESD